MHRSIKRERKLMRFYDVQRKSFAGNCFLFFYFVLFLRNISLLKFESKK